MKNVIIVGAGGFGREVFDWVSDDILHDDQYSFKGFLSADPNILDEYDLGDKIIGTVDKYEIQEEDVFVIAIGELPWKKDVTVSLESRGANFLIFIHNTALISRTATIGKGCIIGPYCFISDHVVLEDHVMFGFYASCGHDVKIGKYSILSPYATVNGFSILEDEVFMGTHSSIAARKRVDKGSKISSGSSVLNDVPPSTFVVGVPGKNITIFNGG